MKIWNLLPSVLLAQRKICVLILIVQWNELGKGVSAKYPNPDLILHPVPFSPIDLKFDPRIRKLIAMWLEIHCGSYANLRICITSDGALGIGLNFSVIAFIFVVNIFPL